MACCQVKLEESDDKDRNIDSGYQSIVYVQILRSSDMLLLLVGEMRICEVACCWRLAN